jgi:hypothetical protein
MKMSKDGPPHGRNKSAPRDYFSDIIKPAPPSYDILSNYRKFKRQAETTVRKISRMGNRYQSQDYTPTVTKEMLDFPKLHVLKDLHV